MTDRNKSARTMTEGVVPPSGPAAPAAAYVVAWMSDRFQWPDDVIAQMLRQDSPRFSCAWTSAFDAKKGTRVFLMQRGSSGNGFFASGYLERDSRRQSRVAAAVDVTWDVFLDPRVQSNLLDPSAQLSELRLMTTPEVPLSHEASACLERLWQSHLASRSEAAGPVENENPPPKPMKARRASEAQKVTRVETPGQLRALIEGLSPSHPMTDRFSARWRALRSADGRQQEQKEVWYSSQHEHWLGWLGEYDGPGYYGREVRERTAQFAYCHIVNPQMLIYLAEASGIDPALVDAAIEVALEKHTMAAMSGAIRRILPWTMVEAALIAAS